MLMEMLMEMEMEIADGADEGTMELVGLMHSVGHSSRLLICS